MADEKKLFMRLFRPKIGVGTKTMIALSIAFWVPISVAAVVLFFLFQTLEYGDKLSAIKLQLKGAKGVFEERIKVSEALLSQVSERPSVKKGFEEKDFSILQKELTELGKKNPYMEILAAIDENLRVVARRNNLKGDFINVGDIVSKSLITGDVLSSTELISKEFLSKEGGDLARFIKENGIAQFIVSPVRGANGKITGAIVSGILLTGNPWLGNTVHSKFGVEMAIFGGEPPESSFLHTTSSLPRSSWVRGEVVPKEIGEELALGRAFYGVLEVSGVNNIVAFEPLKDSGNVVIGAIGVSQPSSDLNRLVIWTIGKGIGAAALVGMVISAVITLFISMDIARPLNFLVGAMEEVAKGELNISVDLRTGDQLEKLGTGFNSMVEGIRKREDRLKKHNEVTKLLMSTLDLTELLDSMLKIVVGVTESQMGIVYLYEEGADILVPTVHWGTKTELKVLKKDEGFPGLAVMEKKTHILTPPSEAVEEVLEMGFAKAMPAEAAYIPLVYQERILGVLVLGSTNKYSDEEISLFDYLASQVSIALDNAIMHQKIQTLSLTDTLTGLYNRRYLNARLEEEWARSIRHNKPLTVLLSDIDNFKSVNDTWGHEKGDEVLKGIAKIVKGNVRKEDLAARYGGEEFVIVLVDTPSAEATKIAEKILGLCRANVQPFMGRAATLSIGVATYPDVKADNYEGLIQAADQAMYKAKISGKDRFVVSGHEKADS